MKIDKVEEILNEEGWEVATLLNYCRWYQDLSETPYADGIFLKLEDGLYFIKYNDKDTQTLEQLICKLEEYELKDYVSAQERLIEDIHKEHAFLLNQEVNKSTNYCITWNVGTASYPEEDYDKAIKFYNYLKNWKPGKGQLPTDIKDVKMEKRITYSYTKPMND